MLGCAERARAGQRGACASINQAALGCTTRPLMAANPTNPTDPSTPRHGSPSCLIPATLLDSSASCKAAQYLHSTCSLRAQWLAIFCTLNVVLHQWLIAAHADISDFMCQMVDIPQAVIMFVVDVDAHVDVDPPVAPCHQPHHAPTDSPI